jgi:hypothetical protein
MVEHVCCRRFVHSHVVEHDHMLAVSSLNSVLKHVRFEGVFEGLADVRVYFKKKTIEDTVCVFTAKHCKHLSSFVLDSSMHRPRLK